MSDFKPMTCPNCWAEEITYREDVLAIRNVRGFDETGLLHIMSEYRVSDDDPQNECFHCEACGHSWNAKIEKGTVEWD